MNFRKCTFLVRIRIKKKETELIRITCIIYEDSIETPYNGRRKGNEKLLF